MTMNSTPFFNIVLLLLMLSGFSSCGQNGVVQFTNLSASEFKKLMDEKQEVVVLDVRTPAEVARGTIEGAKVIDIKQPGFEDKISSLDKEKAYLIYCHSGRRSVSACNIMAKAGFDSLYNLKGGILSWQREYPLVKD
jgi:rhodanese-related sulfurtransferase